MFKGLWVVEPLWKVHYTNPVPVLERSSPPAHDGARHPRHHNKGATSHSRTVGAAIVSVLVGIAVFIRNARRLLCQRRIDQSPRAAAAVQHGRAAGTFVQQLSCGDRGVQQVIRPCRYMFMSAQHHRCGVIIVSSH